MGIHPSTWDTPSAMWLPHLAWAQQHCYQGHGAGLALAPGGLLQGDHPAPAPQACLAVERLSGCRLGLSGWCCTMGPAFPGKGTWRPKGNHGDATGCAHYKAWGRSAGCSAAPRHPASAATAWVLNGQGARLQGRGGLAGDAAQHWGQSLLWGWDQAQAAVLAAAPPEPWGWPQGHCGSCRVRLAPEGQGAVPIWPIGHCEAGQAEPWGLAVAWRLLAVGLRRAPVRPRWHSLTRVSSRDKPATARAKTVFSVVCNR